MFTKPGTLLQNFSFEDVNANLYTYTTSKINIELFQ